MPYSELLDIFEVPSLTKRSKLNALLFLYKLLDGSVDNSDLASCISFAVPRLTSRNANLFFIPFSKTNLGFYSPLNNMCRLYNLSCREVDIFNDSLSMFRFKLNSNINNF